VSVVANVAINIDGKQAQSLLKAIQGEVEKLNGSFDQIHKKTGGIFDNLKDAATSVIGQLAAVGGAAFTLQQAFTTLSNQSKAEAALRTLGVDAGAATQQFAQLSKELNGQASIVELTTAAYDVASSGFANTADQTKILEAATKGAVGGLSDINTVGNAVTSVLNAYGMAASQAGLLVDGFIQTQNDGKILLGEYAALIGRLAPTAAAAGVGIKELNAAVATITAQGVAPETAITGLNQALVSILKPTAEATNLSRQLGIDFSEAGLRSKGLAGFLEQVATATGGSASELVTLFGSVDALKSILPLLSGDMEKFVENVIKQDQAAGVAGKAFNEMSATLEGALKEVDTAFKNLVVAFKPVVPAIIAPFKLLAGTINLVSDNIKGLAMAAAFLGTFVGVLNASAIATKAWALATAGLAAAKKAAGVAAAFLQGVINPASLATTALALGAATAAAVTLGNAMGDAGVKAEEAKGKQGGIADETAKINSEIEKQLENQDKLAPKQQAQADKASEILNTIREQTSAIDAQIASLDRGASINSARYEAEKSINDLQGQQLERQYGLAQTAQQRLDIAIAIFNQQVKAAEIEYKQALENIHLEQRKQELQIQSAQLKYKEIEAEGQLQILKAGSAEEEAKKRTQLEKALKAQDQAVKAAYDNASAQQQIAQYQEQTAAAQLESKKLVAQTALEQKVVSDKIGLSQTEAVRLSTGLKNSEVSSGKLATSTNQIARNALGAASNFIRLATEADKAATSIFNVANQQARLNALRSTSSTTSSSTSSSSTSVEQAANGAYWQGGFKAFAKGGVVTKPTMGLIGEGGEAEYIVPQSKAAGFAANYLSGARGSAAIPNGGGGTAPAINIQTGPVMQQGGTNYVTVQDFEQGLQSVAASLLGNSRSTGGRRYAGVR
jgi:TP901 family phage tail tape measure protein